MHLFCSALFRQPPFSPRHSARLANRLHRRRRERSALLGYWRFDGDAKDSSGKGHDLTLAGAKLVAEGKRGGALESFAGWPVEDKRHAAFAASSRSSRRPVRS